MPSIAENLIKIRESLPGHVTLVAVSKTKSVPELMEAYDAGQRIFGENKIQEMVDKHTQMPEDIQWHMIGHVQTNKVKYMAEFVSLIHGVESYKLLKEINKQAAKHHRVIDCLLQVKIAKEETKFGMTSEETISLLNSEEFKALTNVRVIGLMGMASFVSNEEQLSEEFQFLEKLFIDLKENHPQLQTLSMGMSGDYPLAITHGSTMVRVGSAIFGVRNY